MTNTNRQSNIELLRIILMFCIVLHHFIVHAAEPGVLDGSSFDGSVIMGTFVNGFLYMAVNCFVLISGYFGIKFKLKGVVNIYLVLLFYGLLNSALAFVAGDGFMLKPFIRDNILCLSHCDLWFVSCYVALYLMSPLLNMAIDSLDRKQFIYILVLFTIVNLYFGYLWKSGKFNINGYTVAQFVYLYLIGAYLRKRISLDKLKKRRMLCLSCYCGISLLFGGISILDRLAHIPYWSPWDYNNPFLLASAISLFLFFLSLDIHSKYINFMAKGCLAVYVCHSEPWIMQHLYSFISKISSIVESNACAAIEYLALAGLAISAVLLILSFDVIRRALTNPLLKVFEKFRLPEFPEKTNA